MRLIFCADPLNPRQPDPAFQEEIEAAREDGLSYSLISFEALTEQGNAIQAIRRVEAAETQELAVYRGWMLKPEAYTRLYDELAAEKKLVLINSPAAYQYCHYLPENYEVIRDHTPRSIWLHGAVKPIDEIMAALQPFGEHPVIVKDFVKSRKHEWFEACYIPSAADRTEVGRVVSCFVERQGEDLNEGLVFREFVEFENMGKHSKSGMPLSKEFRLFFLDGQILTATIYWEEGVYGEEVLPLETFLEVAQRVQSRFFTMDVALHQGGSWMIVELGDGQVAGLPARSDANAFYKGLAQKLR
jgi:hypothetical protein